MIRQWRRRAVMRAVAQGTGFVALATALPSRAIAQEQPPPAPARRIPDRGPRLDLGLVEEFVRVAHGNLARTREMLEQQPALVNATWDWGGGDWETGLGGASHMGNKEIAEFLLSRGARMDVFCAAMLGKIEIVKACLTDNPDVVHLKGPHGISLVRHAQAGKQDALVELLVARGATL